MYCIELMTMLNLSSNHVHAHAITTVICTSLLRDTIEYYYKNCSDCYLLLLDAPKAFDRVEYVRLSSTIRCQNMCPTVLRL